MVVSFSMSLIFLFTGNVRVGSFIQTSGEVRLSHVHRARWHEDRLVLISVGNCCSSMYSSHVRSRIHSITVFYALIAIHGVLNVRICFIERVPTSTVLSSKWIVISVRVRYMATISTKFVEVLNRWADSPLIVLMDRIVLGVRPGRLLSGLARQVTCL
jgi:hypothetical protein